MFDENAHRFMGHRPSYYYYVIKRARRKKGKRRAGVTGSGRSGGAAWRSSAGYAARPVWGAPRGRNGADLAGRGIRNWPALAEGEKRLLSPTRNPYAAMQSVA